MVAGRSPAAIPEPEVLRAAGMDDAKMIAVPTDAREDADLHGGAQ
jgi:hypothetical protein